MHLSKVSIWPTGFLLFFALRICIKKYSKKKIGFQHFNVLRSSFQVPPSSTPNESDCESVQKQSLGF